jgi:hypothetical protein
MSPPSPIHRSVHPLQIRQPMMSLTPHSDGFRPMKSAVAAGVVLFAVAGSAAAQEKRPPVCIRTIDIDHTRAPDDRTILFYMKDRNVWRATLRSDCPELRFNGFEYGPTPPDNICANLQTIRVLKSGAVCEIGPLTPDNG